MYESEFGSTLCMRGCRCGGSGIGTVEAHAQSEQPAKGVGHLIAQDAAQLVVVPSGQRAREQRHVRIVIFRSVVDAVAELVRRPGCADRADRPRRRAAELLVLFQQRDAGSRCARLDRSGEAGPAAANDDDVEHLFHRGHAPLAARPALSPAMRPNTAPDIRPVPPG